MKNRSESIFLSLIKKYITFVLIIIISLILTLAFIVNQINISSRNGNLPKITSEAVVRSDYKNMDTGDIEALKGWVEILDEDMKVIYTRGVKKDDYYSYSQMDIINILNMDSHNKYLGIMQPFKSTDGRNLYCLVKYPSDVFTLQLNLNKSPYESGSIIYNNLIRGFLFFLLISTVNTVLFSKWTSKKINKPLLEITEGISKMAHGDYDTRIEFMAEKEFAVIRDSFNYMVERIKTTQEEKEKIEQDKYRMLVDLSHDIKTPIATIQGFSKALYEGLIVDEEKKQRYYYTIYTKGKRVSELVDDLFEFVKLGSVDYKLLVTKSDFCEFTRKIITEFYDEIEEKNIELDIRIPEKEILVEFDEKAMNRAVSNILCNALKYNPEGTKLRIEIREAPDAVILEIGDNGSGIPDHIKDTIFNPFVRGDEARRSDGGTGLGLAIAKKIIEKHNGRLELYTDKGDEKTTFSISL